jgi:hypothetical protein
MSNVEFPISKEWILPGNYLQLNLNSTFDIQRWTFDILVLSHQTIIPELDFTK